jgi:hypothetical protein
MAIELFNLHRLTVEIEGRRRSDRRIIQDLKGENDIVGSERRAVGEFGVAPKFAGQRFAIGRNLPRRRQFSFGLLRLAVDADEASHQAIADAVGLFVSGEQTIESSGAGRLRNHKTVDGRSPPNQFSFLAFSAT